MSPLIAKRERLFGPVHLVLIAVLFAASFYFLLPKQDAFTIAGTESPDSSSAAIGELDLAYLKARSASGQESTQETSNAITALVRSGQVDAAKELLEKHGDGAIEAQQRFALDLELAQYAYFAAETDKEKDFQRLELLNRIELLITEPSVRTTEHLTTSAEITEQLDKPQLSVQLYKLLGDYDNANASQWFSKCAQTYVALGNTSNANACLENAMASASSSDKLFDLKLVKNSIALSSGNTVEQRKTLADLQEHTPLSVSQRETLATTMLASSRTDLAYLEYEKLAVQDPANQKAHMLNAAKWAEASNEGIRAANYLDQAASLAKGEERVALLTRAESLLVAAGENDQAYERLVLRVQNNLNNESVLQEGVVRARQLGKNKQAMLWNEKLVKLNPVNLEGVKTQVKLALTSGDLDMANRWSRQAVALSPKSQEVRKQHAQIAEWSGDPVAAMAQWQWLAQNYPSSESLSQLVRLAELNLESAVGLQGLEKLVSMEPDNEENIIKLIKLYELEGRPTGAASMLNKLQNDHGMKPFPQRELARLYQKHVFFQESLAAWNIYASTFGDSSEASLNRMELYWRLNQPEEAAEAARGLVGTSHISEASDDQLKLLSEISWRYKITELADLIRPRLGEVENKYESALLARRLVTSLEDAGKDQQAIQEATRLWQETGSNDLAFTALNLAVKTGDAASVSDLLENEVDTSELREEPAYWNLASSIYQKSGDRESAKKARQQALQIDPNNVSTLSATIWAYIDEQNTDAMSDFIIKHKALAETEPELWSAFAVAHLQLGLAELSLTYFDRQLDRIEADYNMLLTYADALEYSGLADPARKVRLYAIKRLRPVISKGSEQDKEDLLRQYAQMLSRYGSAEDKEQLAQWMLTAAADQTNANQYWREDIAIGWLMSTQRHEHARLVMAKLHDQRIQTPVWQELSLAMASDNARQIEEVLNGTGNVSVGNHILALRQIGSDREAYRVAGSAINSAPSLSDREIARSQYAAMRSEWPSFSAANVKQTSITGLGIDEAGFTVRHSLRGLNLGLAFNYVQRSFSSDQLNLADNGEHSDIALSLFHGDRSFGGSVTAGVRVGESDDLIYASSSHHLRSRDGRRTLTADFAFNESSIDSPVLRVAAKQNRISLGYEQNIGSREYIRLQADARDITTRVQQSRVARGLTARMEFGIRGSIGSNVWATNIAATRVQNDLESTIPDELRLSRGARLENIISDESTALTLGASISRGGVAGNYPQVSSPRYYLNANVGRSWPASSVSAQLDGGAGIRILGGDELSVGFSYDTQPFGDLGADNDTTSFGVNYHYHY